MATPKKPKVRVLPNATEMAQRKVDGEWADGVWRGLDKDEENLAAYKQRAHPITKPIKDAERRTRIAIGDRAVDAAEKVAQNVAGPVVTGAAKAGFKALENGERKYVKPGPLPIATPIAPQPAKVKPVTVPVIEKPKPAAKKGKK